MKEYKFVLLCPLLSIFTLRRSSNHAQVKVLFDLLNEINNAKLLNNCDALHRCGSSCL